MALAALARREHSCLELRRKLSAKGFRKAVIEGELQRLTDERLQDDGRYAEAYIRYRAGSGYGPVKIRVELKQRGIDEGLAGRSFAQVDIDWQERIGTAWEKNSESSLLNLKNAQNNRDSYNIVGSPVIRFQGYWAQSTSIQL